jgi:Mg-chelatase subunit ChlD
VEDIERQLADRARRAVGGALDRSARSTRPRPADIDWHRTIRANLRHYQAEHRTVIPERLVGHARRRRSLQRELILCLDQSGSMASSVIYAGVFGAALASLPALSVRVVAFDTAVVDLSDRLGDPVDLLFGIRLGGGTDIDQALGYCQSLVTRPAGTVLVLVTDLYEGGDEQQMLRRAASLIRAGVQVIVLLALSDDGAPAYDHAMAAQVAALGAPVFACTPDRFPDLLATAMERRDVGAWAAGEGIGVAR